MTTQDPLKNTEPYVSPGMPPLKISKKTTSFFEFWPMWVMYLPVVLQWLILSLFYRSLTLPLLANPNLKLSGMVGVQKSDLLAQAKGKCDEAILDWFTYEIDDRELDKQVQDIENLIARNKFDFPLVCKPDIGCRGSGVKLVKDFDQVKKYLQAYPSGSFVMLQKLASFEPEAGVFFIKEPKAKKGKIISLALKYSPYVVGNGQDTLEELILKDKRASDLIHLYRSRHKSQLSKVIAAGEPYKLVFSASHSKGAIFKDANDYITDRLTQSLNEILSDLPEFYYGRLDIKFPDIESLQNGNGIEIVEINTASSEPLHIWDGDASFKDAIMSLLFQYRMLFKLGSQNRSRGFKTPGLKTLLAHWQKERRLKEFYPETD